MRPVGSVSALLENFSEEVSFGRPQKGFSAVGRFVSITGNGSEALFFVVGIAGSLVIGIVYVGNAVEELSFFLFAAVEKAMGGNRGSIRAYGRALLFDPVEAIVFFVCDVDHTHRSTNAVFSSLVVFGLEKTPFGSFFAGDVKFFILFLRAIFVLFGGGRRGIHLRQVVADEVVRFLRGFGFFMDGKFMLFNAIGDLAAIVGGQNEEEFFSEEMEGFKSRSAVQATRTAAATLDTGKPRPFLRRMVAVDTTIDFLFVGLRASGPPVDASHLDKVSSIARSGDDGDAVVFWIEPDGLVPDIGAAAQAGSAVRQSFRGNQTEIESLFLFRRLRNGIHVVELSA